MDMEVPHEDALTQRDQTNTTSPLDGYNQVVGEFSLPQTSKSKAARRARSKINTNYGNTIGYIEYSG
jgi:hypothetical protein